LQQIVGKFPERLEPLKANIELKPSQAELDGGLGHRCWNQGYPVRAQEAALEVAVREIERIRGGTCPP